MRGEQERTGRRGGARVGSSARTELAIGFTLGLLRLPALLVIVLIALQAFAVTRLGLRLGTRLSERLRERAQRLAGAALTALGLVLIAEKALA